MRLGCISGEGVESPYWDAIELHGDAGHSMCMQMKRHSVGAWGVHGQNSGSCCIHALKQICLYLPT